MKTVKDLEGKMYEERLRPLGVLSVGQRSWGEASWQLQLLTGSRRAALSSALCDSDRARANGMELCQERGSWGWGTGSVAERESSQALEPQTCVDLKLMEFKKHLDSDLRYGAWIWGGSVWSQKLNSVTPVGPWSAIPGLTSSLVLLGTGGCPEHLSAPFPIQSFLRLSVFLPTLLPPSCSWTQPILSPLDLHQDEYLDNIS